MKMFEELYHIFKSKNRLKETACGRNTYWFRLGYLLAKSMEKQDDTKEAGEYNFAISKKIANEISKRGGLFQEDMYKSGILSQGLIGSGSESNVYLSKDGMKVIKFTNSNNILNNNSLLRVLDGIALFNHLFTECAYNVIGFSYDDLKGVCVVSEQSYINGKSVYGYFKDIKRGNDYIANFLRKEYALNIVTDENFLKELIMRKYSLNVEICRVFSNEKYVVSDISQHNVIIDNCGTPHVIDCHVERK